MDRRAFLTGSVAVAAAFPSAASSAAGALGSAQSSPDRLQRLRSAIAGARLALEFDGRGFSGAGYDWLLKRGAESQAFLLGEEHGIAENAKLAAALFRALVPHGYRKIAIETSPPIAEALDQTLLRGGLAALEKFVTTPGSQAVFFGLREEAEWLAAARGAVPRSTQLLWGVDYELSCDRFLIQQLEMHPKPASADRALEALESASRASWTRYAQTHDPQFIFSFAGDPALVEAVERAWPRADERVRIILDTLRETLEVNRLWSAGKVYESNLRRVALIRSNLLRYWRAEERRDPGFRLFMKMGANHMTRGLNMVDMFDAGSLIPGLVAERGGQAFHLMVLPGPAAQTANFDPTRFKYVPGQRDEYGKGMELFSANLLPNGFTLFLTAPLRPFASSAVDELPSQLIKVIHGFEAMLVMTGSHPSAGL